MFKVNEANWDRIVRIVLGAVLLWLGLGGVAAGALGIVADVVGAVLVLTGIVGICPLYMLLKISTNKS